MYNNNTRYTLDSIIGESEAIKKVIRMALVAAQSQSNVLIYGETGTGKELVAQGIHNASPRSSKPFISQNCASLPATLLEGILFGTVKGSFTGAIDRAGMFEEANNSTILLDEINSMDFVLQSKLLRLIQEKRVRRIGSVKDKPIDIRIIATMNIHPFEAIKNKTLREDLYYRLNVFYIEIPTLKERGDDILLLAEYFIKKYNKLLNKKVIKMSEQVQKLLIEHKWKGNVRELENIIESSMIMAGDGNVILPEHLPIYMTNGSRFKKFEIAAPDIIDNGGHKSLNKMLMNYERKIILYFLSKNQGNISTTAAELDISRQSLQYRMKKYKIDKNRLSNY